MSKVQGPKKMKAKRCDLYHKEKK